MNNWTLTQIQHDWMEQHWADICLAENFQGREWFEDLAKTSGYRYAFGDMSIDEAIDRYECWLEDHNAHNER